jgi:hypothetical protein
MITTSVAFWIVWSDVAVDSVTTLCALALSVSAAKAAAKVNFFIITVF